MELHSSWDLEKASDKDKWGIYYLDRWSGKPCLKEVSQVGNWRVSVSVRRKSKGKGLEALKQLLAFSRNGQNTSSGWN